MKHAKRMLSLLLAVIMSVSLLAVSASAAPTSDRETKAQVLFALGLFKGYDSTGTNFGLADGATREQAILLLIRILGEEKAADAWTGAQPYSDVPSSNYYYRYIGYAKDKGYTNGIGNNKFGLTQSANMTQMATFALRGLGYSEAAGDFVYRNSVPFAVSLGILDSAAVPAKFTRGDAVDILDGAVAANIKNQSYSLLEKLVNTGAVTQTQVEKAAAIVNAPTADIAAGTYTLKCLGNSIRVTSDKLELRNTSPAQTFTITNRDGYSYIQTADGYYVGVTKLTNGTQLVLGTTPYSWLIEKQSGSTYTIRPAEKPSMVVNACEEKSANGTKIIIWTHSGAPKNTLITFTAAGKTVAVTGVKLDQTTANVAVGKSVQITGTIAPANASNQNVTWSSSASSIAKVDGNGVVTGVKAGTATITVKTVDGGKTATCKVTVTADQKMTKSAVTLRNQTGKSITEIYIADSTLSSYDSEYLTANGYKSFSHNKTITTTFEFYADTKFDILLRFSDGTEAEALGLSFKNATSSACDLTLGTKEAVLKRGGATLAKAAFESKANDLTAQSKALADRYNKAITRYNTLIAECKKLKLDQDPAFVSGMNAVSDEVNKMGKTIGEGTGVLTAAQIKEFTANLNDLDTFMTQMDALIKSVSGKPDMVTETNNAIDAYEAARKAYNKAVDAANKMNPNANIVAQIDAMSATIEAMTAKINAVTSSGTPFTAEQVKACNEVTASIKAFTAELQKLMDAANASDMTVETNRAISAYEAAVTAYNKVVDAANAQNLGANPEIKQIVNQVSATITAMSKEIEKHTNSNTPFTAEQVAHCNSVTADLKNFTKELQKLVDAAKAPNMTAESNKAISAYDTAVTAYNKVVDAANAQNLGENADVRTIVNQVSATITAMSKEIKKHTNSNTPFTAEQVAQCNSVTADLKNFTAQLQTLVNAAKAAASKPADAKKTITIINNTGVTFSLIQMAPKTATYYDHPVSNSDLQQGENVTTTIDFTGVSLVWDMQILYPNKASITFTGIDFTNCPTTGTITLNSDDTAQFSW